jgi:hypothetical protein
MLFPMLKFEGNLPLNYDTSKIVNAGLGVGSRLVFKDGVCLGMYSKEHAMGPVYLRPYVQDECMLMAAERSGVIIKH